MTVSGAQCIWGASSAEGKNKIIFLLFHLFLGELFWLFNWKMFFQNFLFFSTLVAFLFAHFITSFPLTVYRFLNRLYNFLNSLSYISGYRLCLIGFEISSTWQLYSIVCRRIPNYFHKEKAWDVCTSWEPQSIVI